MEAESGCTSSFLFVFLAGIDVYLFSSIFKVDKIINIIFHVKSTAAYLGFRTQLWENGATCLQALETCRHFIMQIFRMKMQM